MGEGQAVNPTRSITLNNSNGPRYNTYVLFSRIQFNFYASEDQISGAREDWNVSELECVSFREMYLSCFLVSLLVLFST